MSICSIPDGCIDERRLPFLTARATLRYDYPSNTVEDCAASGGPASVLVARNSVTHYTIYRWRERTSIENRSHTAHQLATTLTLSQEAAVVELCRMLL